VLPYIQGTMDKITKILRKRKKRIAFSTLNSLRNMLDRAKDPIDPKHKKCTYSIPCSCGRVYIGENGCWLKISIKKHCADIIHSWSKSWAVAKHSRVTNHHIRIEEAKVIATKDHYNKRYLREAIKIGKHSQKFNRDGFFLCKSWKPLIHVLNGKRENV